MHYYIQMVNRRLVILYGKRDFKNVTGNRANNKFKV